ncbi:SpaA isopeptide-forming pilin-related protein [Collinsella aerofaciens]|uniref:SpaA isopeptide-forming pilin-related protein n=1 Tax=Collinsella aerofaciens TaxID=74426 RepID=UPI00155DAA06|nr:SpaA isopeptide-forming pilin-related protein [Collinsella aerofaciens]
MNKNIARLAVTAGLTAALSFGGVMAPVTMAFADGAAGSANSITIRQVDGNASTKFKAYRIFNADVINEGNKKVVSNVKWAVDAGVQAKIISEITGSDGYSTSEKPLPKTDVTAQNVADWLAANIQDAGAVDNGALLNKIASLVEATNPVKPKDAANDAFDANIPVSFDESGYYLFLTDSDSISASTDASKKANTGTSPIFAIVGGDPVIVTEKTSIPTVSKAVMDDKDQSWETGTNGDPNKAADSAMDDWVDYKLVGTVASNIDTYSGYNYVFTDKLPDSMTPKFVDDSENNVPDVTVTIDNQTVKTDAEHGYTKEFSDANELIVKFKNLKDCVDVKGAPITVNADSKVTVEYKAKLDSTKIFQDGKIKDEFYGLVGKAQGNKVTLTYSNNPHGNGIGTTVENLAYDYTYGINVTKVGSDAVDGKNPTLSGVEFTLQEKKGNTTENKYIDAKGIKHNEGEVVKLTTDNNGKINVVGLDEGTYVLKEVKPAPGYNNSAASGITFTIIRTLNQTGTDVTPDATSAIVAGQDVVQADSAKAEVGKLSFTIVDQKGSGLPLTGLNGVTFTWIAGGAVLCIGVAHLIRSRKQAEESEQE